MNCGNFVLAAEFLGGLDEVELREECGELCVGCRLF